MILCFDTETTGLGDDDEIIQLSIADAETGAEIMNEYFRPSDFLMERGWDAAAAVTGIYPDDIADCASLSDPDVFNEIQNIFNSADLIIGYHVNYDVNMMERAGFDMSRFLYQDPMLAFAAYYWDTHPGEMHNKKNGGTCDPWLQWKNNGFGGKGMWISKNLSFAAEYLCGITDFGAHDSMNDVYATIAVWQEMNNKQDELSSRYAVDENGDDILDNAGTPCYENEIGNPAIAPNGYALDYVLTYDRHQLADCD